MLFYTPKTCKRYCECIISSFIFFFDSQPPLLFVLARSSSRRSVLLTSVRRGPFCFPSFGYASLLVQFSARKLRSRHFGKDYPVVEVTYLFIFIVVVWRLAVHRRSVYIFLSRLKWALDQNIVLDSLWFVCNFLMVGIWELSWRVHILLREVMPRRMSWVC